MSLVGLAGTFAGTLKSPAFEKERASGLQVPGIERLSPLATLVERNSNMIEIAVDIVKMSITAGLGAVPLATCLNLWESCSFTLSWGTHATGDDSANTAKLSVTKGDDDELSLAIEKLGCEACIKHSVNARVFSMGKVYDGFI